MQGLVERLIERRLQVVVAPPPHAALLDLDCVPLLFVVAFDRLHDELLSEVERLGNRLEPGRADERAAAREIAEESVGVQFEAHVVRQAARAGAVPVDDDRRRRVAFGVGDDGSEKPRERVVDEEMAAVLRDDGQRLGPEDRRQAGVVERVEVAAEPDVEAARDELVHDADVEPIAPEDRWDGRRPHGPG